MPTPSTSLDELCSDPGTAPTSWDDTLRALEDAELFWIATVRRTGQPHMTPLVAVWLDDALHFCTGEAEQKAVNLRNNQNVILLTGCNRWKDGLDVVVEGRACRITDRSTLAKLSRLWARKWDGRWEYEPGDDGFGGEGSETVLVFSVQPTKVLAFAKGTFSATRHVF
jgi:general stress protein 26